VHGRFLLSVLVDTLTNELCVSKAHRNRGVAMDVTILIWKVESLNSPDWPSGKAWKLAKKLMNKYKQRHTIAVAE